MTDAAVINAVAAMSSAAEVYALVERNQDGSAVVRACADRAELDTIASMGFAPGVTKVSRVIVSRSTTRSSSW